MQPIIRLTDYIEEYKNLVYEYYSKTGNIIYTTYYQLDIINTKYDENYRETYRKYGELSGRKWKKIHLMPVMFTQQILPVMDAGEKGLTFANNTISTITVDPSTGLTPHVGDIVFFNISGDYSIMEVTNLEISGTLENPYFKCTLETTKIKGNPDKVLGKAVTEEYIYIEYAKSISPFNLGKQYFTLLNRLNQVIDFLNLKYYDHNTACHLMTINSVKYNFIEFETILSSYESIKPPTSILLSEPYKLDINENGIPFLLCTPFSYNSDTVCYTMTNSLINPRKQLYIHYEEYNTSLNGSIDIIDLVYPENSSDLKAYIDTFIHSLHKKNIVLDQPTDNDTKLHHLIYEWYLLLNNNIIDYSDKMISENMIEAIIEYCIVSKKIIDIGNNGVVLE